MNRKKVSFRDVDDALSWINSQRRAESEIKTFCTCQRAISETIKKGFEGDVLLDPPGEEIKRGLRAESLSVGQCRVKGSPSSISTTTSCTWNFYFLCSANGTEYFWQLKRITTSIDRRGKSPKMIEKYCLRDSRTEKWNFTLFTRTVDEMNVSLGNDEHQLREKPFLLVREKFFSAHKSLSRASHTAVPAAFLLCTLSLSFFFCLVSMTSHALAVILCI